MDNIMQYLSKRSNFSILKSLNNKSIESYLPLNVMVLNIFFLSNKNFPYSNKSGKQTVDELWIT